MKVGVLSTVTQTVTITSSIHFNVEKNEFLFFIFHQAKKGCVKKKKMHIRSLFLFFTNDYYLMKYSF